MLQIRESFPSGHIPSANGIGELVQRSATRRWRNFLLSAAPAPDGTSAPAPAGTGTQPISKMEGSGSVQVIANPVPYPKGPKYYGSGSGMLKETKPIC